MRSFFSPAFSLSRPDAGNAWLPGLPHALAALAAWPVLGGMACAVGLLMASLVSFVVWLPLIALSLNGGTALAENDLAPELTPNARRALFALWTATAWLAAALIR